MSMMSAWQQVDSSWRNALDTEFSKPYMQQLQSFLDEQQAQDKEILPKAEWRFNALKATPLSNVKVVVLGQDPYPTPGHAHGLSFSVLPEVSSLPRSLKNIYKELLADVGVPMAKTGYLQPWAEQGVLLLNTVLSVEAGNAGSHQGKGWEQFTDAVIKLVNEQSLPVVFLLWGSHAQKKVVLIDATKHLIIQSAHPSPLSASKGFFDSKPFSQINAFLASKNRQPIQWQL